MTCQCGGRPKRGAPPISVLRWQDVPLPVLNFGRNPAGFPPTPPLGSGLWAEDTVVFCNRDPGRLYLEFPPFTGGVLTQALKALWGRNCECRPVRGVWRAKISWSLTSCSNLVGCRTTTFVQSSNFGGPLVGVRTEYSNSGTAANFRFFGFTPGDNYASERNFFSQSIAGDFGTAITGVFSQEQIEPGCLPPEEPDPPLPPGGLPYPTPVSPVPPFIPPELIIFPPPARFVLPRPEEDECCDCC